MSGRGAFTFKVWLDGSEECCDCRFAEIDKLKSCPISLGCNGRFQRGDESVERLNQRLIVHVPCEPLACRVCRLRPGGARAPSCAASGFCERQG